MTSSQFDTDPDIYEALVDWSKRLANEGPFYRDLFDRVGARRVLDVACGTGHHAALFRSWGKVVEGADISPRMIDLARRRHGESPELRWVVRGFCDPVDAEPPFDAVVCVGNSLALANDRAMIAAALRSMAGAAGSGGVVVVHLLNLWRLADGPCRWQKFVRKTTGRGDVLIAKGVHRSGDHGYVDVLVVPIDGDGQPATQSIPFLGLRGDELETMARRAGVGRVSLYGGYQRQAYDAHASVDLIMVAEKP